MAFVASQGAGTENCGTAPQILCISGPADEIFFFGYLRKRLDGVDFAP
jgi:hypothetical protein